MRIVLTEGMDFIKLSFSSISGPWHCLDLCLSMGHPFLSCVFRFLLLSTVLGVLRKQRDFLALPAGWVQTSKRVFWSCLHPLPAWWFCTRVYEYLLINVPSILTCAREIWYWSDKIILIFFVLPYLELKGVSLFQQNTLSRFPRRS